MFIYRNAFKMYGVFKPDIIIAACHAMLFERIKHTDRSAAKINIITMTIKRVIDVCIPTMSSAGEPPPTKVGGFWHRL